MLKLKTKTEFQVPYKRTTIPAIVRMVLDSIYIDANNVTVKGYYYYIDADNNIIMLDTIEKMTLKSDVVLAEDNLLPELVSHTHLFDNINQRLFELTMINLSQEGDLNYGTTVTDWETDI